MNHLLKGFLRNILKKTKPKTLLLSWKSDVQFLKCFILRKNEIFYLHLIENQHICHRQKQKKKKHSIVEHEIELVFNIGLEF